jgi:serine-type D-Ala-D-Ala carboxypeptidase/endopeptidase
MDVMLALKSMPDYPAPHREYRMRALAWLASGLYFLALQSPAWASECPDGKDAAIQAMGAEFLHSSQAVGLSVGLLHGDRAACYDFGQQDKAKRSAATANTRYEIGSNSKTFTSTLLAYAVREGRLKLDDDIRRYLPEPYPNLEYEGQPIRVVHLANLTSELPNWLPDRPDAFAGLKPEQIPDALLALHRGYSREDFDRDLHKVTLKAAPGSRPRHSNVAAQLLVRVLERAFDRPYANLLEERILRPLGMKQTGFDPTSSPAALARGYDDQGKVMPYITDMLDLREAGGLISSNADMVRYLRLQLDESDPAIALSHHATIVAENDTVALNWHVDTDSHGRRTIWHTGGTFGFSSYVVLYPESKLGISLLSNESDPQAQNRLVELAGRIAKHLAPVAASR